jgi:hypothetical protein
VATEGESDSKEDLTLIDNFLAGLPKSEDDFSRKKSLIVV